MNNYYSNNNFYINNQNSNTNSFNSNNNEFPNTITNDKILIDPSYYTGNEYGDFMDTNENYNENINNLQAADRYHFPKNLFNKKPQLEIINEIKSEYSHESSIINYIRPVSKADKEYTFTNSRNRFFIHAQANTNELDIVDEEG